MSNESYHKPINELANETKAMHRAINTLMEELETIDWYNQRIDAYNNEELKATLAHNRDEENAHAAMLQEWIRIRDPVFDQKLEDYILTDKPISHE